MKNYIPLNAMQTAVYDILSNDSTLDSYGVTVTDYVQETQSFPMVVIGQFSLDGATVKAPVQIITMTFDIWSDTPGNKEMNQVMDAVCQALTESALSLGSSYRAKTAGSLLSATSDIVQTPEGRPVRNGTLQISWYVNRI